jgi:hypothetical protein
VDRDEAGPAAFHVTCTWTTAIGADGAWLLALKDLARRPGLQGLGYQYVARLGDLTERVQAFVGRATTVRGVTADFVVPPEVQALLDSAHDLVADRDSDAPPTPVVNQWDEARRLLGKLGLTNDEADLVIGAARPPRTGRLPLAGSSRSE